MREQTDIDENIIEQLARNFCGLIINSCIRIGRRYSARTSSTRSSDRDNVTNGHNQQILNECPES